MASSFGLGLLRLSSPGRLGGETRRGTSTRNGFYAYTTNFNLPGGNGRIVNLIHSWRMTRSPPERTACASILVLGAMQQLAATETALDTAGLPAGGSSTVTFNAPAGFNVLDFVVYQSGSVDQGLDYVATVTETPEPNTLILLGTGLLGTAGALFRKMRTA